MKQKKKELMYQQYGKYCLDMSKLVFGGIILAAIMDMGVDSMKLLLVGFFIVAAFAFLGFRLYSKSR